MIFSFHNFHAILVKQEQLEKDISEGKLDKKKKKKSAKAKPTFQAKSASACIPFVVHCPHS